VALELADRSRLSEVAILNMEDGAEVAARAMRQALIFDCSVSRHTARSKISIVAIFPVDARSDSGLGKRNERRLCSCTLTNN
jgi:hypothetical protein